MVAMDGLDKRYALTAEKAEDRGEVGEEGAGGHKAQAVGDGGGGGGGGEGTCKYKCTCALCLGYVSLSRCRAASPLFAWFALRTPFSTCASFLVPKFRCF